MIKILTGDHLGVINEIETIAKHENLPIHYVQDISTESKQMQMGLFYKPAIIYFLANDDFIKSDNAYDTLERASNKAKTIAIIVIETIDKRSKFYKGHKDKIKTIARPSLRGLKELETIEQYKNIDGMSAKILLQNIEIFSLKTTLKLKQFLYLITDKTYKTSMNYMLIDKSIKNDDISFMKNINEIDAVTVLYTIFYQLGYKADKVSYKRRILAGKLINEIISGKLSNGNALQTFILKY
jgi:hypothetical protein